MELLGDKMIYKCVVFLAMVLVVCAKSDKSKKPTIQEKNMLIGRLSGYIQMSCQELNKTAIKMRDKLLSGKIPEKVYKYYRMEFFHDRDNLDSYYETLGYNDFGDNDQVYVDMRNAIKDMEEVDNMPKATKEKAVEDLNRAINSIIKLYDTCVPIDEPSGEY
uniref:Uncharacterized protein n=1 Tax=Clastoptera arizonana TaxID=38151 RepID=A0A1B6E2W0_9HEMI